MSQGDILRENEYPFTVPEWVNWLAQDESGAWWGYSVEPLRNHLGWYENEVGEYVLLGSTSSLSWESSLIKVAKK